MLDDILFNEDEDLELEIVIDALNEPEDVLFPDDIILYVPSTSTSTIIAGSMFNEGFN